jgi:hypothetical protein
MVDDPLNLMRVMPPKGSQPCVFSAHGFLFIAKESKNAGKDQTGLTKLTK